MKAELVNPFYQSFCDVFKMMLDIEITKSALQFTSFLPEEKEVDVAIDLIGDVSGSVLFRFPQSTTLKMVEIMSGMEMDKLDSFVISALGEVSNIISGNAVTYLAKSNYQCDILPPQIAINEANHQSIRAGETLMLPLHTSIGELKIDISLEENTNLKNLASG